MNIETMQLIYLCLGMLGAVLIWDFFCWIRGGAKRPQTTIQWVSLWLKIIAFSLLVICLLFLQ
jgi:hypothetical protein